MKDEIKKEDLCCSLNPDEFKERKILLEKLKRLITGKSEIEKGFMFTFDGSADTLEEVIRIVKMERKCCPFLTFDFSIQKEDAPMFLKITGPDGIKDFLLEELGL